MWCPGRWVPGFQRLKDGLDQNYFIKLLLVVKLAGWWWNFVLLIFSQMKRCAVDDVILNVFNPLTTYNPNVFSVKDISKPEYLLQEAWSSRRSQEPPNVITGQPRSWGTPRLRTSWPDLCVWPCWRIRKGLSGGPSFVTVSPRPGGVRVSWFTKNSHPCKNLSKHPDADLLKRIQMWAHSGEAGQDVRMLWKELREEETQTSGG